MDRDWERLGRAFAEAREAAGLTQVEVAERIGVSRTPIQAIERGRQSNGTPFSKVTGSMRAYARLIGWTENSPQRILDGQDPEAGSAAGAEPSATEAKSTLDLPPAVDMELRSGKTLDSTVVHLGPEADDTRIIVVLKGAEDLSDADLDKLWQQWRRTRRHLQAIPSDPDTAPEA